MEGWSTNEKSSYEYPMLRRVYERYAQVPHDVSATRLVCCQHILEPQSRMMRDFLAFGFRPEHIVVLGKSYSTNTSVLDELREMGISTIRPNHTSEAFDIIHKRECDRLSDAVVGDAPIIILDDGGQLIESFSQRGRHLQFAVEQTSSGFRKLEQVRAGFPIINVARSGTKLEQESPHIARECYSRIENYARNNAIYGGPVLVVGLGPIGGAMKHFLETNGHEVIVFDSALGHVRLVDTIRAHVPTLVIGATGSEVLTTDDIRSLTAQKLYFMSISSSDREFPVSAFRTGSETVHDDVSFGDITFVNNGFPITFSGRRNEIRPEHIEKTIALLEGSVMHGVTRGVAGNGFVSVPSEVEKLVNE